MSDVPIATNMARVAKATRKACPVVRSAVGSFVGSRMQASINNSLQKRAMAISSKATPLRPFWSNHAITDDTLQLYYNANTAHVTQGQMERNDSSDMMVIRMFKRDTTGQLRRNVYEMERYAARVRVLLRGLGIRGR